MRYVAGATIQQLAPDECTVYLHKEDPAEFWLFAFCFLRVTDGKPERRLIPVNPGAGPGGPNGAWGLVAIEGGQWQVVPSIRALEQRPDPSDPEKSIEVETWHQNVAVVGVPPGEPWLPPG